MTVPSSLKGKKKILVIRSGAIGDVIMTTPFLKNLAESTGAKLVYLTGDWSKGVLRGNPYVQKIISFDDRIIVKKNISAVLKLAFTLRKEKFDACFVLDKSWIWGLFARLCNIPLRIGFSRGREGLFHSVSVPFRGEKFEGDYNLDLLRKLGIRPKEYEPELFPTKQEQKASAKFLKEIRKKSKKRIIGMLPGGASNPGQTATIKRWPVGRYKELCRLLGDSIILFGGREDKKYAAKIVEELGKNTIVDACGMSIQQTCEIMKACDWVVTHDSGGLHIASCSGSGIIALFGPTPSLRFAPKGARVVSAKGRPCYELSGRFTDCNPDQMKSITAKQIQKLLTK